MAPIEPTAQIEPVLTETEGDEKLPEFDELDHPDFRHKWNSEMGVEYDVDIAAYSHPSSLDGRGVCGSSIDWHILGSGPRPVWMGSLPEESIRAVVALVPHARRGSPYCSGVLVGVNRVLTASHCLDPDTVGHWVAVDYKPNGKDNRRKIVKVLEDGGQGAIKLDFAVLETEPFDAIEPIPLTQRQIGTGSSIVIVHYPSGRSQSGSAGVIEDSRRRRVTYRDADTDEASSGSAIFDLTGNLLGIHTNGGCFRGGGINSGLPLTTILKKSKVL